MCDAGRGQFLFYTPPAAAAKNPVRLPAAARDLWQSKYRTNFVSAVQRRDFIALPALACLAAPTARAGVPSKKATYRGGTLESLEPSTTGVLLTTGREALVFRWDSGELRVLYADVNSLEYGQKSGRRLGLAMTLSPLFLLSKKRRHYLTIGFLDGDGRQQAAVFELGKKIVRTLLAGLEARTGLRMEYETEQARRADKR